jgi:hypothetical protein
VNHHFTVALAAVQFFVVAGNPVSASENQVPEGATQTYLLAQIDKRGQAFVDQIKFRRVGDDDDILLKGEYYGRTYAARNALPDELVLIAVHPGEYYLSEIRAFDQWRPGSRFGRTTRLIKIIPGKINYIGDILTNIEAFYRGNKMITYEYKYTNATVLKAESKHPELFSSHETVLCIPGEEPILIDIVGMNADAASSAD